MSCKLTALLSTTESCWLWWCNIKMDGPRLMWSMFGMKALHYNLPPTWVCRGGSSWACLVMITAMSRPTLENTSVSRYRISSLCFASKCKSRTGWSCVCPGVVLLHGDHVCSLHHDSRGLVVRILDWSQISKFCFKPLLFQALFKKTNFRYTVAMWCIAVWLVGVENNFAGNSL